MLLECLNDDYATGEAIVFCFCHVWLGWIWFRRVYDQLVIMKLFGMVRSRISEVKNLCNGGRECLYVEDRVLGLS